MLPDVRSIHSITEIGRDAWNACFPGELEDYDYLLAVENAHIKGFEHSYYIATENNIMLAGIPAFFTDYDLATTADGKVRDILIVLKRVIPLTLKLACVGSTATESCPVGFHPDCDEHTRIELFARLLQCFDADTKQRKINLLACKDFNEACKKEFGPLLATAGYLEVTGMPSAISPITFSSIDAYLTTLSSGTRKDMRRKLRRKNEIRIEYRSTIDDLIGEVHAMYMETKNRSDTQFEELTPEYFTGVLREMGPQALCTIYYAGETPIGANLMLVNEERLLDKFFCMRTQAGQDYNLYFISWFANLQYCIDHGLKYYQSGKAGYETKLRLKSEMLANWMYFRHRNWLMDKMLRLASPLLAFDVPTVKD